MTPVRLFIGVSILILTSCATQTKFIPLIEKDKKLRNERRNRLFAFVGQKLKVSELPYVEGSMDNRFYAKYKIIQRVYGRYKNDTIEFTAFDHYGIPEFSNYENVLLFVSRYRGKFYHEKYMFNDVYPTKNGRWAGSYTNDYKHSGNENTTVCPEQIEFVKEISYPFKVKGYDEEAHEIYFVEPFFKIVDNKAIIVYGNYVEELFRLKKDGVLTARGLFGSRKEEEIVITEDVKLEEVVADSNDSRPKGFPKSYLNFYLRTVYSVDSISPFISYMIDKDVYFYNDSAKRDKRLDTLPLSKLYAIEHTVSEVYSHGAVILKTVGSQSEDEIRILFEKAKAKFTDKYRNKKLLSTPQDPILITGYWVENWNAKAQINKIHLEDILAIKITEGPMNYMKEKTKNGIVQIWQKEKNEP